MSSSALDQLKPALVALVLLGVPASAAAAQTGTVPLTIAGGKKSTTASARFDVPAGYTQSRGRSGGTPRVGTYETTRALPDDATCVVRIEVLAALRTRAPRARDGRLTNTGAQPRRIISATRRAGVSIWTLGPAGDEDTGQIVRSATAPRRVRTMQLRVLVSSVTVSTELTRFVPAEGGGFTPQEPTEAQRTTCATAAKRAVREEAGATSASLRVR